MRLTLYKTGHNEIKGTNGYSIGKELQESADTLDEEELHEGDDPLSPLLELIGRWDKNDEDIGDLTVRAFAIEYGKPMQRGMQKNKPRSLYRQLSSYPGNMKRWRDIKPLVKFVFDNEEAIQRADELTDEIAGCLFSMTGDAAASGDKGTLDEWIAEIEEMGKRLRFYSPKRKKR